jgi:hypothetical protein
LLRRMVFFQSSEQVIRNTPVVRRQTVAARVRLRRFSRSGRAPKTGMITLSSEQRASRV